MKRLDLVHKLSEAQRIVTSPEFAAFLAKHQRSKSGVKPKAYQILTTVQHPVSKSSARPRIQLSAHARASNEKALKLNQLCSEIVAAVAEEAYDESTRELFKRRTRQNGAMCCSYNPYTNAIQVNLSNINEGSSRSLSAPDQLGAAGQLHADEVSFSSTDDIFSY